MARLCGIALALALLSCGGDDSGPVIDMLEPATGARGSQVELLGDRFCGDAADAADADGVCASPPNGLVSFGTEMEPIRATVGAWRHQSITVTVPASAPVGPNTVTVTVNGAVSNPVGFEVSN